MENTFSEEFKKKFLFAFTRELIIHSQKKEFTALQEIISKKTIEEEVIQPKEIITPAQIGRIPEITGEEKIAVVPLKPIIQHLEVPPKQIQRPAPQRPKKIPLQKRGRLYIPETRMPANLEYLKPTYVENKTTTDWERLNPLIKDNAIKIIEVIPDEKIRISGSMGEKTVNIILNTEEVNEIINKFAYVSRIPASEGVYKVVVENLIFFAVISGVVGSRFVIQKIQPVPAPNNYSYKKY
jgi:hypothetical protein